MKIRILNDAIRLRLERDEVDAIRIGELVEASTHFADAQVFRYCLHAGDVSAVQSTFRDSRLTVVLPAQIASQWANDETAVSIRGEHGPISVLVEKDFECLDPRAGEDQSNRFRNPNAK
jgi:Family of unknown function (DUF7009)